MRTRAWRRAQRSRVIESRMRNVRDILARGSHVEPGRLSKWNGVCCRCPGCWVCGKGEKRQPTRQERHADE